uniref:Uncharacterized protein n=1 Tax=Acrobeloides nanus TaxID=290746 RepID=A0A914EG43_9BILA
MNCTRPCACPSDANGCSFYKGPSRNKSSIHIPEVKKALENEFPEEICSLTPSEKCSTKKFNSRFHFVVLYEDDSIKHIVSSLRLKQREFIQNEYVCFGNGSKIGGTPLFCHLHECTNEMEATKLCYYPYGGPTELLLDVDGTEFTFPIQEWGTIYLYFYP